MDSNSSIAEAQNCYQTGYVQPYLYYNSYYPLFDKWADLRKAIAARYQNGDITLAKAMSETRKLDG